MQALLEKDEQKKPLKNILGKYITSSGIPNFIAAASRGNIRKVKSDLLALYLNQRLGKPIVLNDIFSGSPYLKDEKTGLPFSAGPDKTPGTEDDIRLDK